jgi:hypothetical protein
MVSFKNVIHIGFTERKMDTYMVEGLPDLESAAVRVQVWALPLERCCYPRSMGALIHAGTAQ